MALRACSTHLGPIPLLNYIENPHIYPLKCNRKFGAFKVKNKQSVDWSSKGGWGQGGLYCAPHIPHQSAWNMWTPHGVQAIFECVESKHFMLKHTDYLGLSELEIPLLGLAQTRTNIWSTRTPCGLCCLIWCRKNLHNQELNPQFLICIVMWHFSAIDHSAKWSWKYIELSR